MRTTSLRLLVLTRSHDRVSYALTDQTGDIWRRGRFPAEAPAAAEIVLDDYALLSRSDLIPATPSGRIGLVVPDPGSEPESIALLWHRTPPAQRVRLDAATLVQLAPLIDARASLSERLRQLSDDIRTRLAGIFPEYLEIVGQDGELRPEALPVLREYPTPDLLRRATPLQVARALQSAETAGRQRVIDHILALSRSASSAGSPSVPAWIAEATVPGDVDTYLAALRQRAALDERIYEFAAGDARSAAATRLRSFSLLDEQSGPGRISVIGDDPGALCDRVRELVRRRCTAERQSVAAFDEYRGIRSALDSLSASLNDDALLVLETSGQLLALAAGRFAEALHHRDVGEELLRAAAPHPATSPAAARHRADAALALAITETCAADVVAGFATLRDTMASDQIADATPALRGEALGLLAVVLVFFGEHAASPRTLESMRDAVAAHGAVGPARAAADIAELFLAGGRPDVDPDELERLRALAEEHSRGTAYRSYYHYVTMLVAYATKDPELGFAGYAEIVRENQWSRHNRRFSRMARLSSAAHLAARGDFASSRRELAAIERSDERVTDGADRLIHDLVSLRLDLAVGEHASVLAATLPDGPRGEESVLGVHLRRYVPLVLILRGSALHALGEETLAAECFERATHLSVMADEWYVVLSGETPEYRAWLEGLDPADLPAGLTPGVHAALRRTPPFISHALPSLTPQQRRVLRLLAQGRSTAAIASELHITQNTMKSHLRRLYARLEVGSREQAIVRAEAYGLLV